MSPEELAEIRKSIEFMRERDDPYLPEFEQMMEHIDAQAVQIAALKEIAIAERAKTVSLLHPIRVDHLPKSDYVKAHTQLEAEYPEAFK